MPVEIRIPAMGEGITDVTITRWLIKEGDNITKETPLVEIATDKVDSEILAPSDGILENILFQEGEVVKVGECIAILDNGTNGSIKKPIKETNNNRKAKERKETLEFKPAKTAVHLQKLVTKRFISPFIRSIALQKNITSLELDNIPGSGLQGRLTKEDILQFIEKREQPDKIMRNSQSVVVGTTSDGSENGSISNGNGTDTEYIELSRMRKAIARNMTYSKQVSPHVTSFVEVNLTKIANWRNKNKNIFFEKYNEKITYLPIIVQAVALALKEFPNINAALDMDNERLVVKKNINIGIATALSDGNLIVPVIKNADSLSLPGITKLLNSLIKKARESALVPEDITGGTFTITNIGTFGNIGGTPIINQPQLAILAVGEIAKKPVAVKTGENYGVAVQDIAELWLSYDHRIVDGYMGGSFLKRVATILEQFDDASSA
jgi:2-oxoglutarate dehydrogenase E2 component (dihydrolipoamide succinyltransferase)